MYINCSVSKSPPNAIDTKRTKTHSHYVLEGYSISRSSQSNNERLFMRMLIRFELAAVKLSFSSELETTKTSR